MGRDRNLTISYSAVQAAFWMDLCVALSFASVYLLGLGYTNASLGIIIAAGNLISALIGPGLSSLIDRYENITAEKVMTPVLAFRSVMLILMVFFPVKGLITSIGFVLYIAFSMSVNSLNLKMYVDAEYNGIKINYGFSRGMGSLAYVLISLLLGVIITNTSVIAVPCAGIAVGIFQFAAFVLFRKGAGITAASKDTDLGRGKTIFEFASANKRFCVLLFGTVLVFFSHNTVCNFLINVVENIGGSTSEMGFLNGFMAAVEIPVMLTFSRFFGNKDPASILKFAFAVFTAKAVAIAAAPGMLLMTGAFVLQAPSFALYTAAIVPYVEKTIPHEDSAKAQSLAFTMTTFSSVLSGTVSGRLYDNTSVTMTLWIAAAVCLAGTIVSIAGIRSGNR